MLLGCIQRRWVVGIDASLRYLRGDRKVPPKSRATHPKLYPSRLYMTLYDVTQNMRFFDPLKILFLYGSITQRQKPSH